MDGGTYDVSPRKSTYAALDYLTLTAVPSGGYVFSHWSGHTKGIDDVNQNPVTFRMGDRPDDNRVVTANFVPSDLRCILTALVQPQGGGTISLRPTQSPDGYPVNETVYLSAMAEPGYVFRRWAGDLAGDVNPATIRMGSDKSVTAIFNPTVSVYSSPSYGGSVSLQPESPAGYDAGTQVTLTAKPAKGYRFVGWEGDVSGSAKSVTITVDTAKTVTARFAETSQPRWWLWLVIGVGGLLAALALMRLVYARMKGAYQDQPYDREE